MKVLIATPTYNYQVLAPFVQSLLAVTRMLDAQGHGSEWLSIQGTLMSLARNTLASRVLADLSFTHLLFIDSDVSFGPSAVAKMLAFDRPVVACAYPHRTLNFAAFHATARQVESPEEALSRALTYPVTFCSPPVAEREFIKAETAATGLMLIKREVFETLRDRHPELYRPTAGSSYAPLGIEHVLQCFEPLLNAEGIAASEDVSFCRRWTAVGGEIWTLVSEMVSHTGAFTFTGRAFDRMRKPGSTS